MAWYVRVGSETVGPMEESSIVDIRLGKLCDALACPVGSQEWTPLLSHPAFAEALRTAAPPPPPATRNSFNPNRLRARNVILLLTILLGGLFAFAKCATINAEARRTADAADAAARAAAAEVHRRQAAIAEAEAAEAGVVAARVKAGGWWTIPTPGPHADAKARINYMSEIAAAHPGEPPLKPHEANTWMQRLRKEMAKASSVPIGNVTVTVGTESASIKVSRDALVATPGGALSVGACSEIFLGLAILGAGRDDAWKAGVRSILCISDGCSASFDLRPTRPDGGGLYGGERCISLADAVKLAGLKSE